MRRDRFTSKLQNKHTALSYRFKSLLGNWESTEKKRVIHCTAWVQRVESIASTLDVELDALGEESEEKVRGYPDPCNSNRPSGVPVGPPGGSFYRATAKQLEPGPQLEKTVFKRSLSKASLPPPHAIQSTRAA